MYVHTQIRYKYVHTQFYSVNKIMFRWRLHAVPLIAEHQARKVCTSSCSLWFDPTGKRIRVYFYDHKSVQSTVQSCAQLNLLPVLIL